MAPYSQSPTRHLWCCLLLLSFLNSVCHALGTNASSSNTVTVKIDDTASSLEPLVMTPFPDDSPEMQTIAPPEHIFIPLSSENSSQPSAPKPDENSKRMGKDQQNDQSLFTTTSTTEQSHIDPTLFNLSPIRVSIPTSSSSSTDSFLNVTRNSIAYYPPYNNETNNNAASSSASNTNFKYEYEPAAATTNAIEIDSTLSDSGQNNNKKLSSSASTVPSSTFRGGAASSSTVPREEARATVFDVVGDSSLFSSSSPSLTPKSLPSTHVSTSSSGYLPVIKPNVPFITVFDVKCEKKGMLVHIEFDKPFHGIIYSKGHFQTQECNYVYGSSGAKVFDFRIGFEYCGTVGEDPLLYGDDSNHDTFYENTIILQFDPHIIEVWDLAKRLRCEWKSQYEKSVFVRPFQVAMLDPEVYKYNGDDIEAWMQINRGKGPYGEEVYGVVKIGEPLTIVIGVNDHEKNFDMQVKDCFATDGYGRKVQLTDYYGCVVREKIMSPFSKIKNAGPQASVLAYANFQAFKFPDRMEVGIKCNIQICRHHCADGCPKYAASLEVAKLTKAGGPIPTSVLYRPHPHHHHEHSEGGEEYEEGSQQKPSVVINGPSYETSSSATSAATLQAKRGGDDKKLTTIDVKVRNEPGYESPTSRNSGSTISITSSNSGSNTLMQRRPIALPPTRPKFDKVPPPSYILQDPYKLPAYTNDINNNIDDFDPEPPRPPTPPNGPPLPPFPPGAPPSLENNNNNMNSNFNNNNNNNNNGDPFGAFANQRIIGVSEPPPLNNRFQLPPQNPQSTSTISLNSGNNMMNVKIVAKPSDSQQQQQELLPKLEAYKRRRRELEDSLHGRDMFMIDTESLIRAMVSENSTASVNGTTASTYTVSNGKRGGRQARILDIDKPEFGMNAVIRVISPSDLQYDVLPSAAVDGTRANRRIFGAVSSVSSSKSSNAICIGVTTFSVILSTLLILLSLATTVATFLCMRFRRISRRHEVDAKGMQNAASVASWCRLFGGKTEDAEDDTAIKPCRFVFVPMPNGGTTTAPLAEDNSIIVAPKMNTYRSINNAAGGGVHRAQPIVTAASPAASTIYSVSHAVLPSPPSTSLLSSYTDCDAKSCSSS